MKALQKFSRYIIQAFILLSFLPFLVEVSVKSCTDEVKSLNEKIFIGNGSPSLLTRLDRVECAQKERSKHIALLWSAIIGLATIAGGEWIAARLNQSSPQPPAITAHP